MEAEASAEEEIADELAEGEVSETLASAIDAAREELQAEVEQEKANFRVRAEQTDAIEESVRQEQDEQAESGEVDQFDSVPDELTAVNSEQAEDSPQRPAAGASAKRKPVLKAKKNSYVRRGDTFVPASGLDLVEGEKLYWYRKRKFGQKEKFIVFGRVERKANV